MDRRAQNRTPPLSWWAIGVALGAVLAVGFFATTWLLDEAADAADPPAARVEAVKTGLGIAAGAAGLVALLVAIRRQWHHEVTAADATHDATERRLTDLYTKTAEQLGSDKAPVRMAGLYALERLAQDHPGQRLTMINLLCAYLRMPFRVPDEQDDAWVQEREVRLTAQRLLSANLARRLYDRRPPVDLDLSSATLIDFSLADRTLGAVDFRGATFVGRTRFSGCHFTGAAEFGGSRFTGPASFAKAVFSGKARFQTASFAGVVPMEVRPFAGRRSAAPAEDETD